MNKVVHIPAYFIAVGKEKTVKVPTGETKKGLFGGEKEITRKEKQFVQTGWSETQIDSERLAKDLEIAINKLNDEGYEVANITPVISGKYNYDYKTDKNYSTSEKHSYGWGYGYGYGYGYSYTDSLIIIAKKCK